MATTGAGLTALAGASLLAGCSPKGGAAEASDNGTGPVTWDEEYDVVIVGSGAAGMSAAIEAADTDSAAKILVVEKMSSYGGNSRFSDGNFGAVGTDLQIEWGKDNDRFKDDTVDMYWWEKCGYGGYRSDPEVTRVFCERSKECFDWMESFGIKWTKLAFYEKQIEFPYNEAGAQYGNYYNPKFEDGVWYGMQSKGRHHKGASYNDTAAGAGNMAALYDQVSARSNITLVTGTEVTGIIREGALSGDVLGITVKDSGGERAIAAKRGVILAAGGFSSNPEMLHSCDNRWSVEAPGLGCEGVTGEVLLYAQDLGADVVNMDFPQPCFTGNMLKYAVTPGSYLDIDDTGNRFWKETKDVAGLRSAKLTILYEHGLSTWHYICDANSGKNSGLADEEFQWLVDNGELTPYDTLEEAAAAMNVPADALKATIERYNGFVDTLIDEDFGQYKDVLAVQKFEKAPWYVGVGLYKCNSTPGGLRVSPQAEVVDRYGNAIPRLYAAGEIMGTCHGLERNGGCGWTEAVVFGRVSGAAVANLEPRA